jgi:ribulose bisphosphate carboxylase small subunit
MRRKKIKPRKLRLTKPIAKPQPTKPKKEPAFIVPRQDAPGCGISPLFHRTSVVAARRILRHGFKDSTNHYMTQRMDTGVWLSSVPPFLNKGTGDVLLRVDADLSESEIAQYEWVAEGRHYREWLVPAAIVNPRMTITVVRRWP